MSSTTVGDLMTSPVLTVSTEATLLEIYDLMSEERIRHVPVVDDEGDLVGLVSHRDLLRGALGGLEDLPMSRLRNYLSGQTVGSLMSTGVETVEPDDDIVEVADQMLENKFGCVPVCEGNRLVGILTEADFVRFVARGD